MDASIANTLTKVVISILLHLDLIRKCLKNKKAGTVKLITVPALF